MFVNDKTYKNDNLTNKFYPNFSKNLSNINKIKIQSNKGSYDLLNNNNQWVLPEYSNYPVDLKALNNFLLEITNIRTIDKKTNNPKYFQKLGLSVPIDKENESKVIKLYNLQEELMYSFIIGKKSKVSKNANFFYIRKLRENQTWLFLNNLLVHEKSFKWADIDLAVMDRRRFRSIIVQDHQNNKNNFRVFRNDYADSGFKLDEVPEGYELKEPLKANEIAAKLEKIELINVKRIKNFKNKLLLRTINILAFDGQQVKINLYKSKEKILLTIAVKSNLSKRLELSKDGPLIIGLPKMVSKKRLKEEDKRYQFFKDWIYEVNEASINNLLINKPELIKKIN